MKVAAFHGSPRAEGNIDILLRETVKAIDEAKHEIKLFQLNNLSIKPCSYGGCDGQASAV